ncbi:hypothetical protein [Spirosoma foliorum]|uniref:Glycosyltransferase RgtA/B/C/D-like domain-containing protein n=1 Tax=Spirosoma foliorum TaxID=2710596 RepID=A0A7G5GNR0_9BACT|nr:hypothetical protein [Spirosoma foliorum]QMW00502.1 hypothetical protein H3H32_21140 [Spirosoma foliorum]
MRFNWLIAVIALALVYTFVFFYRENLAFTLFGDEVHFWDTVLLFSKEPLPSVHLLNNYPEVIAPLPFMIAGWVINIFGHSVQYLRILNLGLSFAILMLFLKISPNPGRFWLAALGLILFPYYYFCSTIFYTDILALSFILLGWVCYLKQVHWASCLFFIAAISSRQYAVVFPAVILCYELGPAVFRFSSWQASVRWALDRPYLIYYVIAGLALIAWVLFWGGLGPAPEVARQKYNDTVHKLMYKPGFVLYASACLGLYYVLPEIVLTRKLQFYGLESQQRPWLIGWVILIGLLIAFFPAEQMYDGFFVVKNLGFFDRHLELIGIKGIAKQLIFGFFMLLTILRFASPKSGMAGWVVLLNLILMGKAHIGWDKYLLPTIATLWLLTMFDKHWPLSKTEKREELVSDVSF